MKLTNPIPVAHIEQVGSMWVAAVRRMVSDSSLRADESFKRAWAQIEGDGATYRDRALAGLLEVALVIGYDEEQTPPAAANSTTPIVSSKSADRQKALSRIPVFPPSPSFVDLISGLRTAAQNNENWDVILLGASSLAVLCSARDDPFKWESSARQIGKGP